MRRPGFDSPWLHQIFLAFSLKRLYYKSMKNTVLKVRDGKRVLIFRPLRRRRSDGVTAELIGYEKRGKTFWY